MRKIIIILVIVCLVFLGFSLIRKKSNDISGKSTTNEVTKTKAANLIKGSVLISDKEFLNRLIKYMKLDIKQDYKEIYRNYLSKGYLSKYYLDVTNEEEYEESKANLQLFTIEYLEITNFKALKSDKYQVDLIKKDGYEGDELVKKVWYIFIKENDSWKLDDSGLIK